VSPVPLCCQVFRGGSAAGDAQLLMFSSHTTAAGSMTPSRAGSVSPAATMMADISSSASGLQVLPVWQWVPPGSALLVPPRPPSLQVLHVSGWLLVW